MIIDTICRTIDVITDNFPVKFTRGMKGIRYAFVKFDGFPSVGDPYTPHIDWMDPISIYFTEEELFNFTPISVHNYIQKLYEYFTQSKNKSDKLFRNEYAIRFVKINFI